MSSIATAIITCDRTKFDPPSANYFRDMCKSMERSGFRDQLEEADRFGIFDAGPQDPKWMDWMPHLKTELWCGPMKGRLDLLRNTHRAMTWMVTTGCDYGILLSDDFICCKNWLPEVRRWLDDPTVPRPAACYALCARYPWTRHRAHLEQRWASYPLDDFYCAIVAYPMAVLRDYLVSTLRVWVEAWINKSDWIPRDYARLHGLPIYAHCPDLFQHIGVESSLGHKHPAGPHDLMFPGEDFDALDGDYAGLPDDTAVMAAWRQVKEGKA